MDKDRWTDYARYINLGASLVLTMTAAILLGLYGGRWLDERWGTSPFFLILGVLLGVGMGLGSFYSKLKILLEDIEKRRKGPGEE
ncbi:MAG TPA: AtpZ/AtpI family protein [Moorella mulderi]|nr:AtpZ/AtpI family protein [Moorella mulderi]